ncbi:DUF6488 family protein [Paraglaciecola chathamensis]|jgi:hypothetical protein|uniref:PepSY domain-containing protein n=1 Tax=Paraglaciecola chathamensis TaxID=368405 RepID=A0A8H9LYC5_9ALTE|nr:DUF6488 family protein [Paraglaciecola oceanifecundans]GGZ79794.1 hypothetical protein GCM10011274_42140 [Paraglaciecola oceanifecundans]
MKILIKLAAITAIIFTTSAMAHSDGHGKVDKKKILQAAQTSAKALTFKDKGMSVGKLDSSWNKVTKDNFTVVEETRDAVLLKATNAQNNQTLLFIVSKAGKVMNVKDEKMFKNEHGHAH